MQNQNKFVGNSQSFAPLSSSTELLPLYMCCNIHHFGITKRKNYKLRPQNYKLRPQNYKLRSQNYKLRPQKLQVTRSKLTSLTAETNKFQLTNMLFITF